MTSKTSIGSVFPLTFAGGSAVTSTAAPAASRVLRLMMIFPPAASALSREATFTQSPMTLYWRLTSEPRSPATATPELMPMPTRASSGLRAASCASSSRCIATAARTARAAWSGRAIGAPKTPSTASPMNLST